jgi:hypothetical protein
MPDPLVGLHPSELFSHRVAVRRLRRRSPRGVGPRSGIHLNVPLPPASVKASLPGPEQLPSFPTRPKPRQSGTAATQPAGASTAEPNGRPTLREPRRTPSCRTVTPLSEAETSSSRTVTRRSATPRGYLLSSRARPPEPEGPFGASVRPPLRNRSPIESSVRPHSPTPKRRRAERPLDPPAPKRRRTRRPALRASTRRPPRFGHQPDLREPEDSFRPDRSLAFPLDPKVPGRFERCHPHPVWAEAPSGIRRPQHGTRRAEAPLAPYDPSGPPSPEGYGFPTGPAFRVPTRRPVRVQRALRPAPPNTEAISGTDRRSPLRNRSPFDSSSSARPS